MTPEVDTEILGYWQVIEVRVHAEHEVKVIGPAYQDVIHFHAAGFIDILVDPYTPFRFYCRCRPDHDPKSMDWWIYEPSFFTLCVYRLCGHELAICGSAEHEMRPKGFEQDLPYEILWRCTRTNAPKLKRKRHRARQPVPSPSIPRHLPELTANMLRLGRPAAG